MEPITKKLMMKRLKNNPLKIMAKTKVLEFSQNEVRYTCDGKKDSFKPFDTVIIATGLNSDESVADFLKSKDKSFQVIGDAKK